MNRHCRSVLMWIIFLGYGTM